MLNMDEKEIKLECLKMAHTGSPSITIKNATEYFGWIMEGQKNDVQKTQGQGPQEVKRRGRKPKIQEV